MWADRGWGDDAGKGGGGVGETLAGMVVKEMGRQRGKFGPGGGIYRGVCGVDPVYNLTFKLDYDPCLELNQTRFKDRSEV